MVCTGSIFFNPVDWPEDQSSIILALKCTQALASLVARHFWFKGSPIVISGIQSAHRGHSIYGAVGPIANLMWVLIPRYTLEQIWKHYSFITLFLDRVGRKKPLLFGATVFVVLYAILAAIVATNPPLPDGVQGTVNVAAQRWLFLHSRFVVMSSRSLSSAGVAMIFMLSIFFSFSFGPVSWVLASEVFPTSTRSIGTSVATCSNWVCHSEWIRYLKA